MRETIKEGLDLAQQLAALPFTAARQALASSEAARGPWGDVMRDSLAIGEGLARLPFKATAAYLAGPGSPSLEERVAELERRLGVQAPPSTESPS